MTRRWPALVLFALFGVCVSAAVAQQDRFSRWDRNGDGRLTRDELPESVRPDFDRVDANRDGFISREEDAARRNRSPGGQPAAATRLPRMLEGVSLQRDIPYASTDNPRQRLDLYLPRQRAAEAPLPVVVWIHGGAWRAGDKSSGQGRLAEYVRSGRYAGVSVGYRLSGEAVWPAQIHDCKAAIRWIRAHAKEHGLDPERIGVWGSSAGGHLVAMLGTSGGAESLEGILGNHRDQSSRVGCVADYFGPSDLLTIGDHESSIDHNAADSPEAQLIGGAVQKSKDAARAASPITYVSEDDPPFLIVHGTADMTVPFAQSEILAAALKKAGVEVTMVAVDGAGHGFKTPEPDKRVRAFFDRHLRGIDVKVSGERIPADSP